MAAVFPKIDFERPVSVDGVIVSASEARISALAHAVQRGSAIFEVVSFHAFEDRVAIFRLPEHVARLRRSAEIVGLALALDAAALAEAARAVVGKSGLREGLIRFVAAPASLESDLVPTDPRATTVIAAYARDDLPKRPQRGPLRITIPSDVIKAPPAVLPPLAKVAAAYLGPMIARRRALAVGFDEIVLRDQAGMIAEAPTANAFAVIAGTLVTPPLGTILDGITRDAILAIAREERIPVEERPLPVEAFHAADEAFLSATSFVIAPIGEIDGRALAAPGPITERLRARMMRISSGTDPRSADWSTFV
jgi:branched-chain amino acid aminotransferase